MSEEVIKPEKEGEPRGESGSLPEIGHANTQARKGFFTCLKDTLRRLLIEEDQNPIAPPPVKAAPPRQLPEPEEIILEQQRDDGTTLHYINDPKEHYLFSPQIFIVDYKGRAPRMLAPTTILDKPRISTADRACHSTSIEIFDAAKHVSAIKLGAHTTEHPEESTEPETGLHRCTKASAIIINPANEKADFFAIADGLAGTVESAFVSRYLVTTVTKALIKAQNTPGAAINAKTDLPTLIMATLKEAGQVLTREKILKIIERDGADESQLQDSIFKDIWPVGENSRIGEHALLVACREQGKIHIFSMGNCDFAVFDNKNIHYSRSEGTPRNIDLTRYGDANIAKTIKHFNIPTETGGTLMAFTQGVFPGPREVALQGHQLFNAKPISLSVLHWTLVNLSRIRHSEWPNDLVSIAMDL